MLLFVVVDDVGTENDVIYRDFRLIQLTSYGHEHDG